MNLIKSMNKSYEEYRPDVLHQCLLNLFESPLNKAGMLQVYIRTKENVLIEISPNSKNPMKSFSKSSNIRVQFD
jgi:rRNA small subunit pseudouridine methyltransferase Nep1